MLTSCFERLESWQAWMHECLFWLLPIQHMDGIIQRNLQNRIFSSQQHCCQDLTCFGWFRINQTEIMTWGERLSTLMVFTDLYDCVLHKFDLALWSFRWVFSPENYCSEWQWQLLVTQLFSELSSLKWLHYIVEFRQISTPQRK